MLKKKKPNSSDMSFTIESNAPLKKKKKKPSVERERRSEPKEDQDAVDAAKDKLRRQANKKKLQRLDEQKEKLKSKPKKETFELVPATPAAKRLSKIDKKSMVSIIGDDAEEMQNLFEQGSTEQAIQLLNRRLIQTCIDLLPQLETGIRNSNGRYGVHSLNGTIQTIRELVIDLQSMQDRGAVGETIIDKIIRPAMLDIATQIMQEYAAVLSEVKDVLSQDGYAKVREAQITSRNRIAGAMNAKFEAIKSETISFLQR